ncbi:MAG: chemotaxis protein CheA, partial [Deltaproteobacteria bacterium]
ALNQLHQISSMLQKTAMSMRMVPIKNTFQKMVRLVRDLARSSGKKVSLEMKGEETEIDRNVVEELYEPMVHMIRNAVDHGIEPPEQRLAKGKPEKGTIELLAYQRGGSIIIEIRDDGRGLDKEKILSKAIDKGIISGVEQLSESEIYNLIFKPGFSTSETVTEISGRGVGMDVVKKALEKLRGRVEIKSKPDKGSTFIITLPLTLAIIDGIIVRVAEQRYIIPALGILKSFRPNPNDYSTVEGKGEMIMVRGELVPLVRLHHLFELSERTIKPWEGLAVLIGNENEKLCLLVDELVGKEEVVIKTLGEALKNVKGLAGGAILGDGRVGLILDIPGLFAIAKNSQDLPAYSVQKVA